LVGGQIPSSRDGRISCLSAATAAGRPVVIGHRRPSRPGASTRPSTIRRSATSVRVASRISPQLQGRRACSAHGCARARGRSVGYPLRTRSSGGRGSVIGSGRSRTTLGERQSAAMLQLGIHTCFQTALASHREPAMPAYQGAQPLPWFARIPRTSRLGLRQVRRRLPLRRTSRATQVRGAPTSRSLPSE
jgi:hypothetical protein